ncbi:tRNA (adenosine(37)-N6)-threonylcarbamoyltransferase complex ATPase subunit type 1 TsaE [candidate division WOR-3 bacterium JGI_Cruoil_03_51_56]|uniref:tRNA threonylcarbamoyladenosine biosynthesis protein TsaE n=1 Tax=candidate division WOR-3 bacterium JGI_Cruoil_03_51_56 TaxID=1973747 RepID=A0A235BQZ9_UNCW3|nr:MAG: tRNA (adenosine(37)-N6)-threonylcarbamoyltransferase complex ATPase subunit type 1 TsaE [candidate division WOR-3 bacterium JGI_Cruoil_03_51_56]
MAVFHTASAAETINLGRRFAARLKVKDVVAFYGELGSGKTTMIKGIAGGLGVNEVVKSPSFVIITEYQGRVPVYHIDLYRISKPNELEGFDLEEYFEAEGVCLIEWAERAESLLPERTIRVRLELAGKGRRIEIGE